MIEYVIAHNPDDRIINRAAQILKKGGLVCLPTDTNWQVLADPFNKKAVEKLYQFKKENTSKHFSLLCSNISIASDLAYIDDRAFKILKKIIPGHYTFIFEASKKMSKALKASKMDKEVGIRFVPTTLTEKLLETINQALISTNISSNMVDSIDDAILSYMIDEKHGHKIDMIIDPGELEFVGQSTILSFTDPYQIELVRTGAGDTSFL